MDDWLSATGPAVLVTVAIVEGSGPRECGAKMLVDATRVWDTIGGGHLEHRAIETARAMLAGARPRHFERYALGPSLGQCCGGVVHLAFELLDAAQAALLGQRRQDDSWRVVAIDGAADSALFDGDGRWLAGSRPPVFARDRGAYVMQEPDGRRWLVDPVFAPRAHLVLFGAGHVGTAIVRALAHLPCNVTWVDERDDMFPPQVPANVTVEASDVPEALVAAAPAGASYLVMTHSHALDQRLTEAIMARPDVGWFGLIGSKTKRRQFEHRLHARGVDAARIDAMVCPIGLAGITNKAPAVIAASVCAQLLTVWDAMQRTPDASMRIMAKPAAAITERV
ncbi:xanthine dehydrogenase accessory protein XdhC [Massilia sp. DJPM01]|uniref:xanthine dehydrogenase accessory protein XdhC n=1 Tax=Massilia sp. DJPM01 TaxID=3024404 RepID=UPI00259DAE50|nr:xanthine dehydrogenase accessory protein XdhC [Massilia sp. DJPM01]MDM5176494.1 xanthine dehydrogenase accessory protein XdhC [Massilia sp. DJPM01]